MDPEGSTSLRVLFPYLYTKTHPAFR